MWMWDAVKAEAKVENSCIFELPPDVGRSDLSTESPSQTETIFLALKAASHHSFQVRLALHSTLRVETAS